MFIAINNSRPNDKKYFKVLESYRVGPKVYCSLLLPFTKRFTNLIILRS